MKVKRWWMMAGGAAVIVLVLLATISARRGERAQYLAAAVERGEIRDAVDATGTVNAVVTVQVGSQVSGTVSQLKADFNSRVHKGDVIALIDPTLLQGTLLQAKADLENARANVAVAQSDVTKADAAIEQTKSDYDRAAELEKTHAETEQVLAAARAAYETAQASLAAAQAGVVQARAQVKQKEAAVAVAQTNLDHTVIRSPVDGIVVARNVDVGQTVAASFQAPVLFVIANDLSQMQVNASIDEADIGRVRVGQDVSFTVDAFPDQNFKGRVEQVRLQPVTTNNVVTYNTIISVDNSSLKLMPGMTATVSVAVRQANNALRIPTSALRFRPEGFEAAAGPRAATGGAGGGGVQQAGGQGGAGGGGAARARQGGPGGFGGAGRPGGGQGRAGQASVTSSGPRPGLVFVVGPNGQPQPVRVKLGISDGRYVEVTDGLQEGTRVITGTEEPGARPQASASPGTTNPFQPGRFQPRSR